MTNMRYALALKFQKSNQRKNRQISCIFFTILYLSSGTYFQELGIYWSLVVFRNQNCSDTLSHISSCMQPRRYKKHPYWLICVHIKECIHNSKKWFSRKIGADEEFQECPEVAKFSFFDDLRNIHWILSSSDNVQNETERSVMCTNWLSFQHVIADKLKTLESQAAFICSDQRLSLNCHLPQFNLKSSWSSSVLILTVTG